VKLYLDEDISPRVADIARGRCQLDIVSAHEIATLEWEDSAQLHFAAEQARCLVTRNRDDFIAETLAAYEAQTPHAGVLILTRSLPNDQFTAIAAALCSQCGQPWRLRSLGSGAKSSLTMPTKTAPPLRCVDVECRNQMLDTVTRGDRVLLGA
jgi:predicted nuclease of predicted toxin-antitoxin system